MFNRIVLLVLTSAFVGIASGQSSHPTASKPSKPAELPLQLTVRVDKQTYHLSDGIETEVQITNIGKDDVYVYDWSLCWNDARWLTMRAFNAKGDYVHSSEFLADCLPPPPVKGEVYQFIRIEPHRFYGMVDGFPIRELVDKAGEYDIDVTYESCLAAEWISKYFASEPISKLPLWTMEKPILKSNRIPIKVVP
jgi:hypothetical protein